MSAPQSLPMDLLIPWARSLLVATFGITLIRAMRGDLELSEVFEALAVGLLSLTFYASFARGLSDISFSLNNSLQHLGGDADLKKFILDCLNKAAEAPAPGGKPIFNVPSFAAQVFRTGVWGVLSLLVEWIFLVVSLVLRSAHAVLWKLLLFLFPIGCGLYPIFPRILVNQVIYAIELSLWLPLLMVVELATADVARTFYGSTDDIALYMIAVELVAILLILYVPAIAHRLMSGALSGDLGTASGAIQTGKRMLMKAHGWISG